MTPSKNPSELKVALDAGATTALVYPAEASETLTPARTNRALGPIGAALVLGHGAGAGQRIAGSQGNRGATTDCTVALDRVCGGESDSRGNRECKDGRIGQVRAGLSSR